MLIARLCSRTVPISSVKELNVMENTEKMLNEEIRGQLKEILDGMGKPVVIEFFGKEGAEQAHETQSFLSEIAEIADKVTLNINMLPEAQAKADELGVKRVPGFALIDSEGNNPGVQFYGLPGGHEINSFIYALMAVSGNKEELPEGVLKEVKEFGKDINIKVFVTLSCPHCPGAVSKAHRLALENPNIKAEMIDANLFPELSDQYNVSSVPKIVFNDGAELIGNQPVESFLNMMRATQG